VIIAFGYKRISLTEEADLQTLLDLSRLDVAEGESERDVAALREALERGYAGQVAELALSDDEAHTLNTRVIRHFNSEAHALSPGLADLRKGLAAYIAELERRDDAGR
jgi:Na+-translocating ferredoxin:NAD+ oxidoreductase RnfG subunit